LTVVRFITDPTYVYAAAVALAAFFLIFNLGLNFQGFLLHLKTITGPLSKNAQLFPHTPAGHLRLLGRALDQLRFSLGWPLLGVCAAGLIRALTSKTRNPLLLSLPCFFISFEIFLIHVVMYNYARFYLPAGLVLSFFGGQFLGSILKAPARFSILSRAAVAAVFIYSGLYAFSLDYLMVKDSRYAAERWMKENIPVNSTIGLGVLPVYGPRIPGFRHFKMENPFMRLNKLPSPPHYVLLTIEWSRRFLPPSGGEQRIRQFYLEKEGYKIGYKIIYRHKTPFSWLPLNNREVTEQLNTINPEVLILKKRDVDPAT
jgi:hypothetical protein